MAIKGIDVSAHNGLVNWQKVINDGIGFAIIRIGIGSDIKSQDDKRAIRNMDECERFGIPYGVYLYSYALKEEDVHSESQHMERMVKGRNPKLGIWFDMEDADGYKRKNGINPYQNKELLTKFCTIFMEDMKNYGYNNVGVYASYDYFKNVLFTDELRKVGKIWLAHWGIKEPSMPCTLWQYSSDGKVSGISGRVDMNYLYEDAETGKADDCYPAYTGHLPLSAALNSMGIDGSFEHRSNLAKANGIDGYRGTYQQNMTMYNLLKAGKLKKSV